MTDLILGTAGHIDHGKTSLIQALTGVNTDRLPEEQRRGITIDLGFAQLAVESPSGEAIRYGIVDVPGHERFVRNMLAGATGIDVALLVVAADDSVKPQTREHLEILRLLDLHAGVIALTKCDRAESDWIDLVESEVRELVADTFLADATIVRTSVPESTGIEELRGELALAAEAAVTAGPKDRNAGPFRMAIDRVFTVPGHGTVVTGSVTSGSAALEEELAIEPGGQIARVRGLHNHETAVDEIHRGQRAAINLAGVHYEALHRGQELASSGHLVPSRRLTVEVALLPSARRALKHRGHVRIHLGTGEFLATAALERGVVIEPGERGIAQFTLETECVAVWGRPLVLRSESPVETIGGGRLLDACADRMRPADTTGWRFAELLASEEPLQRVEAAAYFAGLKGIVADDLPRAAGVDSPQERLAELAGDGRLVSLKLSPTQTIRVQRDFLNQVGERIEMALGRLHDDQPLETGFPMGSVARRFEYIDRACFDAIIRWLTAEKRLLANARGLALRGRGPQLTKNETILFEEIVTKYEEAGLRPPLVAEIAKNVVKNRDAVPKLVALGEAQGRLVKITADMFLHREADAAMREKLTAAFATAHGLTVSEIKDQLEVSRKFAVPICEYLDRIGFTKRDGDVRVLVGS